MKKEREEDLEANLTGEHTAGDEAAKPRWFLRLLPTKKKHRKVSGINAPNVIIFAPLQN